MSMTDAYRKEWNEAMKFARAENAAKEAAKVIVSEMMKQQRLCKRCQRCLDHDEARRRDEDPCW